MKLKFFFLLMTGTMLLQARPEVSYHFLNKMIQAEQYLLSFTKYQYLYRTFPVKTWYRQAAGKDFEHYETALRQVTIDLNDAQDRTVLNRMIEAKNRMKNILEDRGTSEEITRLVETGRSLRERIDRMHLSGAKVLMPSEQMVFHLKKMRMLIEGMNLEYLFRNSDGGKEKKHSTLLYLTSTFERHLDRCRHYRDWRPQERIQCQRISAGWKVLKTYLNVRDLPQVIEVGSRHLSGLIDRLRQRHEESNEG